MNFVKLWHLVPQSLRDVINEKLHIQQFVLKIWIRRNAKEIKKFKDIGKGKRCFIIGNGPSLTLDDLEKLKEEDTFGSNYIFNLFDKTTWRPNYYFLQDYDYLRKMGWIPDKRVEECQAAFISGACLKHRNGHRLKNEYFYYLNGAFAKKDDADFSKDITKNIHQGCTVTYSMIQAAVYMGYREIYLLGVDHNYPSSNGIKENEKKLDYMKELNLGFNWDNPPALHKSTVAYAKAREVCEGMGIKIFNATRGGKLEAFERCDIDKVLNGEG